MYVKILCDCGAKYGFDLDPGQVFGEVKCPVCGKDGTAQARSILDQQQPAASVMRISHQEEPKAAIAAGGDGASIGDDATRKCPRHVREDAVTECCVCGKPICSKCMEQTGFVCSVFCREQARKLNIDVPVYQGQIAARNAAEGARVNLVLRIAALVVILLVGCWAYYTFYASRPRVILTVGTTRADPCLQAIWTGPDRVAVLTRSKVTGHDVKSGRELWRSQIQGQSPADNGTPQIRMVRNKLWLASDSKLSQLDADTGKPSLEVSLPQPLRRLSMGDEEVVCLSGAANEQSLLHIDLNSGKSSALPLPGSRPAFPLQQSVDHPYVPAHGSVVHLEQRLLESRIVTREAIKPSGPSKLESSSLRASDSMEATHEMLNQMQRDRTGGVEYEDESRYQVTLKRYFSTGQEWTGEVVGPPQIFPLKTVDVLVAGKTIHVFSKANQKLWEAKLTYNVGARFRQGEVEEEKAPAREIGSQLLFFDQGMLSAFDLRNGTVAWRATAVGISDIVPDQGSHLYVCATTAGPEAIKYNQDVSVTEKIQPLLIKLERSSGRVLWQQGRIGEKVFPSGKFVYAARGQVSRVDLFSANTSGGDFEAPTHFRVWRIDPSNGRELWEYYRPKSAIDIEPQQNRVLLRYADEVRVLGFSAL